MNIKVEVVQSFDKTIEEGKHEMKVKETHVEFCNFSWNVKIEKDNIFLFTSTKTTIWRIRLYAKNNLFTGEWRKHIGNNVFEIIALLNLSENKQFPISKFKLDDKYKKMLPEPEMIEKKEKFSWEKFLFELEIDKGFAQKFEDANLELDDLQYFTKNDFKAFVKDVILRIKLMKYIESNYDCKVK
jgi:hypothetical protein